MRELGAFLDEIANLLWDNVSNIVSHFGGGTSFFNCVHVNQHFKEQLHLCYQGSDDGGKKW
jgi:hypothetical protein